MSDRPQPTHGAEYGPCAICGGAALPKFGEFLCSRHGTRKYANRVKRNDE
jgi:hypothetical protein